MMALIVYKEKSMKEYISEETGKNPFIEILDKRTFHAYRFTGTDENKRAYIPTRSFLFLYSVISILFIFSLVY
jgi:hypothetical protein